MKNRTRMMNLAVATLVLVAGSVSLRAQEEGSVNVSGVVYEDANANGVKDGNETQGGQSTITLLSLPDEEAVATVTTDESGNYLFEGVEPGQYRLLIVFANGLTVESDPIVASTQAGALAYDIPVVTRATAPQFPFLTVVEDVANPANTRGPEVSPFRP